MQVVETQPLEVVESWEARMMEGPKAGYLHSFHWIEALYGGDLQFSCDDSSV